MNIDHIYSEKIHGKGFTVTASKFVELKKELDSSVDAVVVGIDYNFNYLKASFASLYI